MGKIKLTLAEYKQRLSVYDKRLHDCFGSGSVDEFQSILDERDKFSSQYGVNGTEVRNLAGDVLFDLDDDMER